MADVHVGGNELRNQAQRIGNDNVLLGALTIYSIACTVALLRSPAPADTAAIIALFQFPLQVTAPTALRLYREAANSPHVRLQRGKIIAISVLFAVAASWLVRVSPVGDRVGVVTALVVGALVAGLVFVGQLWWRHREYTQGRLGTAIPPWWIAVSLLMAAFLALPMLSVIGVGIPAALRALPVWILLLAPPVATWMIRRIESGTSVRRSVLIPGAMAAILLTIFIVSPYRLLDPYVLLAGKLRIGVNGHLPGWNFAKTESGGNGLDDFEGFDIELVRFLHDKYRTDPEIIPILQDERLHQWDESPGLRNGSVDLVISTFSITKDRVSSEAVPDLEMSMAGPYYLDTSRILNSGPKEKANDRDPKICTVKGTTGALGADSTAYIPPKTRLEECFDPFYDPADLGVTSVRSDWGILRAYDEGDIIDEETGLKANDVPEPSDSSGYEMYGIGFARNGPDYCRALTGAIKEFLLTRWENAFNATLYERRVVAGWHKPVGFTQKDCSSIPEHSSR